MSLKADLLLILLLFDQDVGLVSAKLTTQGRLHVITVVPQMLSRVDTRLLATPTEWVQAVSCQV